MGHPPAVVNPVQRGARLDQPGRWGHCAAMNEPASNPPVSAVSAPRPAASLIVLRETGDGPQALMGMRGAGHVFMPNRLVFPGGAVDAADYEAAVAAPLRAQVRAHLERAAAPPLAAALAVAAARELEEETGMTLGAPPRLDALDYLCRAVTPAAQPRRFDARFLVVPAEAVAGAPRDRGELDGVRFYPLDEALALDLAVATRSVLQRLAEWRAMDARARAARTRLPVLIERAWDWE
jgi:8-oxo-dGTP pyrophosphatase MutT (NUDIX family)